MKTKIKNIFLALLLIVLSFPSTVFAGPYTDGAPRLKDLLTKFLGWLLQIVGYVALISFVLSGFMYLLSRGDDSQMQKAKKAMTYSVSGVIVAMAAIIILRTLQKILAADSNI